ncbi:MAG: hypothetical protein LBN23_05900 [Paludibacter sp.]|jgi:hypothetical protein|nr:hypothetical protein [Paludibacter sp.]
MEALSVEIINPKAKTLLRNLASMNLIQIRQKPSLSDILTTLRRNENQIPSLEEITQEVELVRKTRYDETIQNSYRY